MVPYPGASLDADSVRFVLTVARDTHRLPFAQ